MRKSDTDSSAAKPRHESMRPSLVHFSLVVERRDKNINKNLSSVKAKTAVTRAEILTIQTRKLIRLASLVKVNEVPSVK